MSATENNVVAQAVAEPLLVPLENLVPLIENCKGRRTLIRAGKHPNPRFKLKMKKVSGKWHSSREWLCDWINRSTN